MATVEPHPPFEVRPPQPDEVVFRLVDATTASADDFRSDEADRRRETVLRTLNVAIYRGFSVRSTLTQAMKLARHIGKPYVAEVVLESSDGDVLAPTLRTPGHKTVWAEADLIQHRVRFVHRVEA